MARLPPATRDTVPPDQASLFDQLTAPSGLPPRSGPGSALIHVPQLRQLEKELVNHVRFESDLPERIIELATLQAGRALDCDYVWGAHVERAARAGLRVDVIDALRADRPPGDLSAQEKAAYDFGKDYFTTHKVGEPAYRAAVRQFGIRGTVELSMVYGCYSMLALVANSFEVDIPAGRDRLPPSAP